MLDNTSNNSAKQLDNTKEKEDIKKEYLELNEKCDLILEKIEKRKRRTKP